MGVGGWRNAHFSTFSNFALFLLDFAFPPLILASLLCLILMRTISGSMTLKRTSNWGGNAQLQTLLYNFSGFVFFPSIFLWLILRRFIDSLSEADVGLSRKRTVQQTLPTLVFFWICLFLGILPIFPLWKSCFSSLIHSKEDLSGSLTRSF